MAFRYIPEETKGVLKQIGEYYTNVNTDVPKKFSEFQANVLADFHHTTEATFEAAFASCVNDSMLSIGKACETLANVVRKAANIINNAGAGTDLKLTGGTGENLSTFLVEDATSLVDEVELPNFKQYNQVTANSYDASSNAEFVGIKEGGDIRIKEAISTLEAALSKHAENLSTMFTTVSNFIDAGDMTTTVTTIGQTLTKSIEDTFVNAKKTGNDLIDTIKTNIFDATIKKATTGDEN